MADHEAKQKSQGNLALPTGTYDFFKRLAQIYLPAAGTLYVGLAQIWHLPNQLEVIGTVTVVDTFLGVVLHISSVSYNNSDKSNDGALTVDSQTNEVADVNLSADAAHDLLDKDQVVLKVNSTDAPSQD